MGMDFLENRAEQAEEAGDLETALESWKELSRQKQDEPAFFCRYGRVAQKLGMWKEADDAFAHALRLDPTSSLILENLGSLWANRSDVDETEALENAKRWFLRALEHERNARILTQLAGAHVALADYASGRDAFEEAIQIDPNYEEALYNLAVLEEKSNPPRSLELLERAIQIEPDYLLAHQALSRLAQRAKDLARAEYHFRRSLEIDPADYWSHIYLANLLGAQGRNVEAEQAYKLATDLHPEISGGLDLFARFLDSVGKSDEAASLRARGGSSNP
jgi:tetratricopeptide (TPR) repeat protein